MHFLSSPKRMVLAISGRQIIWGQTRLLSTRISRKKHLHKPAIQHFRWKPNLIEKVIMKVSDSLRSNLPTRTILLIPIFEGKKGHPMRLKQGSHDFWKQLLFRKDLSLLLRQNTTIFIIIFALDFFLRKQASVCVRTRHHYRLIQQTGMLCHGSL